MLFELLGPLLAWLGFQIIRQPKSTDTFDTLDPYSELHFMVIANGSVEMEKARQLIGSIHAHRGSVHRRLPVIHLVTNLKEASLWEGVRVQTKEQVGTENVELMAARLAMDYGLIIWIRHLGWVFERAEFQDLWHHLQQHGSFESPVMTAMVRDDPLFNGWLRANYPSMLRVKSHGKGRLPLIKHSFGLVNDSTVDFSCSIAIKPEAAFLSSDLTLEPVVKGKVCLGIATTGRKVKRVSDHPLLKFTLGTLKANVEVYVGYDEGDVMTEYAMFEAERLVAGEIHWLRFVPTKIGAVTMVWNGLFTRAMQDGCEYFYQLNDDVTFVTVDWLPRMLAEFEGNPNLHVVGPNDRFFNCTLMTQVMVRRAHWDRYGFLFPPEIINWHCDTWITHLYGQRGTKCLPDVIIENRRDGTAKGRKARYRPCPHVDYRSLVQFYS